MDLQSWRDMLKAYEQARSSGKTEDESIADLQSKYVLIEMHTGPRPEPVKKKRTKEKQ